MNSLTNALKKIADIFTGIIYISSIVLSIVGYATDNRLLYAIFKAMFVPSLMFYTFMNWPYPRSKNYALLQLAFFFAWVGDILISLPKEYVIFLFFGGWCFLFQHIFYIWLNVKSKTEHTSFWKTPYWGLPSAAYIALFSISYWSRGSYTDKFQYGLYSFILGTSFYTSFYRKTKTRINYWILIIAFTFFAISDVILIIENFLYTLTSLQASSVLLTYYIAQSLICYAHLLESGSVEITQTLTNWIRNIN